MAKSPSSASGSLIHRVFKIQPGEGGRLGLLLLYSAAFGGGLLTVGYRGVGSALFLSRLPTSAAPYLFILPAVAITLILLIYNRIAARVKTVPLTIWSTVLMFALCVVFRLLLETEYANSFALLTSIYLFTEAILSLVGIQLWATAGQVLDARQARRLFPVVATGATISSIAAGFSLGPIAALLGVNNLVVVVAIALGICAICAWALGRYKQSGDAESKPATKKPARSMSFVQTARAIWKTPLLRAIGFLTILVSLLINIGWYQFSQALQANFAGQDQSMVAYMGAFEVYTGILALIVQFLLTPYIIRRFGLFVAMLFFPIGTILLSAGGLAAGGTLLAITAIRSLDPVFRYTINDVATNLLYLPVPLELRQRAKELFGVLYAVAFGLYGLVLLAMIQFNAVLPYIYWSIPAIILALLWIGLMRWTRQQYLQTLTGNVTKRRFDLTGVTLNITDPSTIKVLAATLRKNDNLQVLHALELISSAPGVNWNPYIEPLLAHPSPDIRLQALRYLSKSGRADADAIAGLFSAHEPEVSAAAVEAYCEIAGPNSAARINPFLDDPRPAVRGAAVVGLMKHGDIAIAARATDTLHDMAKTGDYGMRQEAAHVVEELAQPNLQPILSALLNDPDPSVRVHAIYAAEKLPDIALVPQLILRLTNSVTAPAAGDALVSYKSLALPALAILLSDQGADPEVRTRAARILAKISTPQSAAVLAKSLPEKNNQVKAAVLKALADLKGRNVELSIPDTEITKRTLSELEDAYRWYTMRGTLKAWATDSLLDEALALRSRDARNRVFDLLAIQHGGTAIHQAREALETSEGDKRPQAIELLDNVLSGEVRDLLIPLIEAPAAQIAEIGKRKFSMPSKSPTATLEELASNTNADTWLKMCAIRQLEQNRLNTGGNTAMMLSTIERVLVLKQVPLFARIPGEELARIAEFAEEIQFDAGDVMIKQGEPGDCIYVTVDGQTQINISGVGNVAVRDAPTVLGEMALILSKPRSAGCIALTDILALKIDREPFQELLAQKPDIAIEVIKVLAERLDQAQQVTPVQK